LLGKGGGRFAALLGSFLAPGRVEKRSARAEVEDALLKVLGERESA
jgi:hypothetical protein